MLQEAIEKNKGFLRVCAVVAVLSGAVSIAFAVYMVAVPLYSFEWWPLKPQQVYYIFSYAHSSVAMVLRAMMMFALAAFIQWALDRSRKPGWILRNVSMTIYLYVALQIVYAIVSVWIIRHIDEPSGPWSSRWIGQMALSLCGQLFWMVPWVLLGMAAGKGVKLIEEAQARRE